MSGGRPGVFGKLPARGDFLARDLPEGFADIWHGWLVTGLATAARALGEDYVATYLKAPVWRFALPPGIACAGPVAGVLLPSMDAVERLFPLTLVATLAGPAAPAAALGASVAWFQALEKHARAGLADGLDVAAWLDELAMLMPPPELAPAAATDWRRIEAADVAAAVARLDREAMLWTEGSPCVAPCVRLGRELPAGAAFTALLVDGPGGAP